MISSEAKIVAGIGAVIVGMFALTIYHGAQVDKRKYADKERQRQHDLDLKSKEATFPPEYWTAKAAEYEASVRKHQIDIQSEERLKIDQRNREDAEKQAIREFEKDAPAEYWEQKRLAEEEKTKRKQIQVEEERSRRLDEREREIARRNAQAIEAGAKSLERAIRHASPGIAMV